MSKEEKNKKSSVKEQEKHCDCNHEHHHKHECEDDCDCGCHEGKDCTCEHDDCGCSPDCDCGCQEGKDCTCEHEHCGCGDHEDETVIHGFADSEEFKKYEKAFIQLEDALIKCDKELTETKKRAEENERLAVTYKKDLERYKERAKEQEQNMKLAAVTNIADKLIPILDNFEQALKVTGDPNVIKGFEMVEGMLKNAVKNLGIEEIDALGKDFNPNFHNAVSKRKTKDAKKDNTVAEVYQKGYKMAGEDGKVIRHSMVEIYLKD